MSRPCKDVLALLLTPCCAFGCYVLHGMRQLNALAAHNASHMTDRIQRSWEEKDKGRGSIYVSKLKTSRW